MTGILIKGHFVTDDARRLAVWEVFKEAARKVWTNADKALFWDNGNERGFIADEQTACGSELACVIYAGFPRISGNYLISFPREFELRVTDKLLEQSAENIRKVMIHEAVHLGVRDHGRVFREICSANGGVLTSALKDPEARVEKKVGARYQFVRSFTSDKEATAWAREQAAADMKVLIERAKTEQIPVEELRKLKPKYRISFNGCCGK